MYMFAYTYVKVMITSKIYCSGVHAIQQFSGINFLVSSCKIEDILKKL